jgi:hypothetical protein
MKQNPLMHYARNCLLCLLAFILLTASGCSQISRVLVINYLNQPVNISIDKDPKLETIPAHSRTILKQYTGASVHMQVYTEKGKLLFERDLYRSDGGIAQIAEDLAMIEVKP